MYGKRLLLGMLKDEFEAGILRLIAAYLLRLHSLHYIIFSARALGLRLVQILNTKNLQG